jgi:two-component system heavy metal sensor histidine kinase CusS
MGPAFGAVWATFVRWQQRELDAALLDIAHREAAAAADGKLEFSDEPVPPPNAAGPLPKYGVLYRRTGATLFSTNNFAAVPPRPRDVQLERGFDFEHEGVAMRGVLVPVKQGTGRRLLLAAPRNDFEEDASVLSRAMLLAFVMGCGWVAVVALAVAGRLDRNHRSVAEIARRVASGDTSARVELRTGAVDVRQLAADLNPMIERLLGLLASRETFIAHAAHELRTPLTSLRIELEHVLQTGRAPCEFDAAVCGALESTHRLTDLADDLLQLARLKRMTASGTTCARAALADAVDHVAAVARERVVDLRVAPLAAVVRGERRSLARVFRNVLENAIRFSPPGGYVRVDGDLRDRMLFVTVTDQGPGVDARDVDRIFEPFSRTSVAASNEGSGLGLAIARGVARSSGGDIRVEPGRGGRFLIALPLGDREVGADANAGSDRERPARDGELVVASRGGSA